MVEYHSINPQTQDRVLWGSTAWFKRKTTLIKMEINGSNVGFCMLTVQNKNPTFGVALGLHQGSALSQFLFLNAVLNFVFKVTDVVEVHCM